MFVNVFSKSDSYEQHKQNTFINCVDDPVITGSIALQLPVLEHFFLLVRVDLKLDDFSSDLILVILT